VGKFIPVEPEKWAEMVKAQAENARLKAEVERLRKGDERDMTTAYLYAAEQSKDTIARLKAEVERLTKAGDVLYNSMMEIGCNEMADNFQHDAWFGSMKDWNAAKEGKQP
jgi:hypothetical protein